MTEETSLESRFNSLEKKLEHQERFTRTVVVVCTTAILAVLFYMLTEIFGSLPAVLVANFMANLDKINFQWRALENSMAPAKAAAPEKSAEGEKAPADK